MKPAFLLALCGCVLLLDGPAASEDDPPVDCSTAETQMDMTICAQRDFGDADDELNAQYKLTRKYTAAQDAELEADMRGAEKALRAAQRAWVSFRDAHCEAYGFAARGGSMEPMLVANCLAELSRERTKQLKVLADGQAE